MEPLWFLAECGMMWLYLDRNEEAVKVFEALIVVLPNDPTGHAGLGEAHMQAGRFKESEIAAKAAVRAGLRRLDANAADRSSVAWAYYVLGSTQIHQQRIKEGRQSFAKAVEIDPEGGFGRQAAAFLDRYDKATRQ